MTLLLAVEHGDITRTRAILVDRTRYDAAELDEALRVALFNHHLDIAELLVESGADVNFRDATGLTSLHCAIEVMTAEAVEFLLSHGADPNQVDFAGQSPLLRAMDIELENSKNRYDSQGDTSGPTCRLTSLLLANGADTRQVNRSGESALQVAVRIGHRAAQALLE